VALVDDLIGRIKTVAKTGRQALVILDLDGTLYDNTPRTLRIFQEYAHRHSQRYPHFVKLVDRLPITALGYKVRDTLERVGVTDAALIADVEAFWTERFFTNRYVLHDLPIVGAVEFVRRVHAAGAVPVYLTGRDAPNMLLGTIEALQRDGFPVGRVDTRLILKEAFEVSDDDFKRSVIAHLNVMGEVVAALDNEPGLCNLFAATFPQAAVTLLETTCAPGAPTLARGIHRTPDFLAVLGDHG
jgi:hypothetical protein